MKVLQRAKILLVEDDDDLLGLFLLEDAIDCHEEAEDRAREHALAVRQRAADEREVRAVGERHPVEEEETGGLRGGQRFRHGGGIVPRREDAPIGGRIPRHGR